ncbi:hypothetical protein [Shewanella nanhaiensis]|uniref:Uncharacterized protein n=1 Tax=Shewanella nanhaiensis TaxID=2864872 RepID=A0ABS7E9V9_9GAMM|nr:hypothetical protein [Shewanella nanhaiensis]MBW8186479.1 hypothetical protein [Shewanella nanhaiensis]
MSLFVFMLILFTFVMSVTREAVLGVKAGHAEALNCSASAEIDTDTDWY